MSMNPPAGWHPDPSQPNQMRWWDGAQWTDATQAAPASSMTGGYTPSMQAGVPVAPMPQRMPRTGSLRPGRYPGGGMGGGTGNTGTSLFARNQMSVFAVGVAILYVGIAAVTNLVVFGILPISLAIRAFSRKEPLAPVALIAAVITVAIAVGLLSGHL